MKQNLPITLNIESAIPVGTDNFAELMFYKAFVDKSMFIKEFLEASSGEVVLITRPRRWGKSLNMDMLRRFLSIEVDEQGAPLPQKESLNRKLFVGGKVVIRFRADRVKQLAPLKIAQQCPDIVREYQGQYPVISLKLSDVKENSYQEIAHDVKKQILGLYTEYSYLKQYSQSGASLLDDSQKKQLQRYFKGTISQEDLKGSLRFLSELLYKHFGKPVYILIDDYDAPINNAYHAFGENTEEFAKVLQLFGNLLGATLKDNPYLARGLLTGMLRIAKAGLVSELDNLSAYTLLDQRFITCYGFREQELEELLDKVPAVEDRAKIRHWYKGYHFGGETLYNPFSIMSCLSRDGAWTSRLDSGVRKLVDLAFASDEIQKDLQTLIAGKSIFSAIETKISFDILQSPVGLFSLLLFSGYLHPVAISASEELYELSIPNYEVKRVYGERLVDWISQKLSIEPTCCDSLARFLAMGTLQFFEQSLKKFLIEATSFYQTGDKMVEVFYSGLMLCLLYCLSYYYHRIESAPESGRDDVVLVPKVPQPQLEHALVLQYKVSHDASELTSLAEAGLEQIMQKGSGNRAKGCSHVKKVLQICLAFSGKQMVMKNNEITL